MGQIPACCANDTPVEGPAKVDSPRKVVEDEAIDAIPGKTIGSGEEGDAKAKEDAVSLKEEASKIEEEATTVPEEVTPTTEEVDAPAATEEPEITIRMADPDGDEGIYKGQGDADGKAHGAGCLTYDDGEVFLGIFEEGKFKTGVCWRLDGNVRLTMTAYKWDEEPAQEVVERFPCPFDEAAIAAHAAQITVSMCDPEGDEGSYTGPGDTEGKAHGAGRLTYSDGEIFLGIFEHGKFQTGVCWKLDGTVRLTMKSFKWDEEVLQELVERFPCPFDAATIAAHVATASPADAPAAGDEVSAAERKKAALEEKRIRLAAAKKKREEEAAKQAKRMRKKPKNAKEREEVWNSLTKEEQLEDATLLVEAAAKGDQATVMSQFKMGTRINAEDRQGRTALRVAAQEGKLDICELLVESLDADMNARSKTTKDTALHIACSQKKYETVIFLVKHGADRKIKNKANKVAADLCKHAALQKWMKGANPEKTPPPNL